MAQELSGDTGDYKGAKMCLSRLEKFRACKTGYKVMTRQSEGMYSPICWNQLTRCPINTWIKDKDTYSLPSVKGEEYETGFHVFHNKRDARTYMDVMMDADVLVRVMVQQPIATGYDGVGSKAKVTVAKQIKILEEVQ